MEKSQETKQGTKEGSKSKQSCQADKQTNQELKKLNWARDEARYSPHSHQSPKKKKETRNGELKLFSRDVAIWSNTKETFKKLCFEVVLMVALLTMGKKKKKKFQSIITWCDHYFEKAWKN